MALPTDALIQDPKFIIAWEKSQRGDHLDNSELELLVVKLGATVNVLSSLGPKFELAWHPLMMKLMDLHFMQQARARRFNAAG